MIISDISEATRVREIRGLSPTIAIHQKTVSNNPRSTVGTITEIYDFFRLLFTNIGVPYCTNHPEIPLIKNTLQDIVDGVSKFGEGEKFHILIPLELYETTESMDDVSKRVTDMGFVRFQIEDTTYSVAEKIDTALSKKDKVFVVVDRLVKKEEENFTLRLKDSLRVALDKGDGFVSIYVLGSKEFAHYTFHASCPKCGYHLENLTLSHFSFNSHHGACETCHGLGFSTTFREDDIVSQTLTLAEGALKPWVNHPYYTILVEAVCQKEGIDPNKPFGKLPEKDKKKILYGVP